MFFLALSASFWFILTLDREYEFDVEVPVVLAGQPHPVIITTGLPPTLRVTVKAEGTTMLAYRLRRPRPVVFNFADYERAGGHAVIPMADASKQLAGVLTAGTRIVAIHPETLEFYYTYNGHKRVPVRLTGRVNTDPLFYLSSVRLHPDSVTVYAPKQLLDTLNEARLAPVNLRDLQDTTRLTCRFRPIKGVKFVPDTVQVQFAVDQLTEKTVLVPVQWVNFPATKVLRTFPSKVSITFQVGTSLYRRITADNFVIVVNYANLLNNKSNKCRLQLKSLPPGVSHVRISPQEVDYVIEDVAEE